MPVATRSAAPPRAQPVPAESAPLPYLPNGCPPGTTNVSEWTRMDPADLSTKQLFSLNYSQCTWSVTVGDIGPIATPHEKVLPEVPLDIHPPAALGAPRRILKRRPGYLVGFNCGEWGGTLLWYTPTGKLKGKLVGENVVELLPGEQSTIALFGLAHLGGDYGRAVEIVEMDDTFKATRSVDLGSAPSAAVRKAPTTVLVVTHDGLLELHEDFSVTNLLVSKWGMLYPTSVIVAQDGTIYVGMRGVVAEVKRSENAYIEKRLLPAPIS